MQAPYQFRSFSIEELFGQVWQTGSINRQHQRRLKRALLDRNMNPDERAAVDRMLHAVRRGWLKLKR